MHTFVGPGSLIRRPDTISSDYTYAHSFGPVQLSDFSQGLYNRPWRVRVDNAAKTVYLCRANDANTAWEAETVVFVFAGADIIEIDAAFDQQGRIFVCAERATGAGGISEVWCYYFNPLAGAYQFVSFGTGRTPRAILDDPFSPLTGDVLVFYIRDGNGLRYRQQRERYATEYGVDIPGAVVPTATMFIEDLYRAIDGRLHILYSDHDLVKGQYNLYHYESVLYPWVMEIDKYLAQRATINGPASELRVLLIQINLPGDNYYRAAKAEFATGGEMHDAAIYFGVMYDKDSYLGGGAAIGEGNTIFVASVPPTIINHALFDKDSYKSAGATIQNTSTLLITAIVSNMADQYQGSAASLAAGGTLV